MSFSALVACLSFVVGMPLSHAQEKKNSYVGIALGPANFYPKTPSSRLSMKDDMFFSLQIGKQTDFLALPSPLISGMNLSYWEVGGISKYHDRTGGGAVFNGTFPYKARFYVYELLVGIRVLGGFPVQPFILGGAGIGGMTMKFDSSSRSTLNSQGEGYRLKTNAATYGYFWSAGLDWNVVGNFGLTASYRYTHMTTANINLLENHLTFNSESWLLGMHLLF